MTATNPYQAPALGWRLCMHILAHASMVAQRERIHQKYRRLGLIPGSRRSPGEENGNPLQYSCLGNPMDRGVWWATVHGVIKSRTQPSNNYLLTKFPKQAYFTDEEREIQKSNSIWAHIGSGGASSRLGAGHLDP